MLKAAAKRGDVEAVKNAISEGAEVDRVVCGMSALHWAAHLGHADVLEALIEAKANVDTISESGGTALYFAAARGHIDAVNVLIRANAKCVGVANNPLVASAAGGHVEVTEALASSYPSDTTTTAIIAAIQHVHEDVVDVLLDHCGDVSDEMLLLAAERGSRRIVHRLLHAGADVNYVNGKGEFALLVAVRSGNAEVVEALTAAVGCDVDQASGAALFVAVEGNHTESVQLLLRARANANVTTSAGETPLHVAFARGHMKVAEMLLQSGAKAHLKDKDGKLADESAIFADVEVDESVGRLLQQAKNNVGKSVKSARRV